MRILGQKSPKSELWLKRYGEKSFRDLFVISRKWLGLYFEIYSESRGSVWNFVDYRIITDKDRGFFAKLPEIIDLDLFLNGKMYELGLRPMDHMRRWSITDAQTGEAAGVTDKRRAGAMATRGLLRCGENEDVLAGVLICSLPMMERRHGGGAVSQCRREETEGGEMCGTRWHRIWRPFIGSGSQEVAGRCEAVQRPVELHNSDHFGSGRGVGELGSDECLIHLEAEGAAVGGWPRGGWMRRCKADQWPLLCMPLLEEGERGSTRFGLAGPQGDLGRTQL
jgi:hypothetical protein